MYCRPCFKRVRDERPPNPQSAPNGRKSLTYNSNVRHAPANVFQEMPLSDSTKAAIWQMNILDPTPIQKKSIPILMDGRDLVGQARTGSGKTLAFAAPMVEMCDPSVRSVQGLVLAPTRELAIQIAEVTEAIASNRRLRVALLYGGRPQKQELNALKSGAHIVIGTPGRTLDHLRKGSLDLRSVRLLVLDEADEMLDKGFAQDVEAIIDQTPYSRQTALLSSTMPSWVTRTASKRMKNPVRVSVDAELQAPPTVRHMVYTIERKHKISALQTLLNERGDAPVIVFGKTKRGVRKLAGQLDTLGYPVGALQGNLSQNARERVMADFRSGESPILVATNVAARGIDVEGVGQVINYDLPDSEILFTHRVGRTGRMGRSGEAVTFITRNDEKKWDQLERSLNLDFTREVWKDASR